MKVKALRTVMLDGAEIKKDSIIDMKKERFDKANSGVYGLVFQVVEENKSKKRGDK